MSLPIALISLEIYFGLLAGYLISKFFGGEQAGHPGNVKSIVLNLGKYKFHLHHWVYGAGILASVALFNFSLPFPQFSYGFLGGLVVHGITSYPDWHKILIKKHNV